MRKLKTLLPTVGILLSAGLPASAQSGKIALEEVVEEALKSNNLVHITRLQQSEQASKVREMQIKRLPVLSLGALYMYRFNIGSLTVPAGTLGALPTAAGNVLLPSEQLSMNFGEHNTFLASAMLYQPLTQQFKIASGIAAAKTDAALASLERTKAELDIVNGVEKLAYGLLAVRAQMAEAEGRIAVARQKRYDAESASMAGKALEADLSGLDAQILAQQQQRLACKTKEESLLTEMQKLSGLDLHGVDLADSSAEPQPSDKTLSDYLSMAMADNVDLKISEQQMAKSAWGVKAAKQSYLPDVGMMAGYSYQNSLDILSKSNPFVGVSFQWNLHDVLSNRQTVRQSKLKREQAAENEAYTRKATKAQVEKCFQAMTEAEHLMQLTRQALDYAEKTLRIEQDRREAGLTTVLSVMEKEADLAKAQADHYAAKQSYKVAQADMQRLTSRKELKVKNKE